MSRVRLAHPDNRAYQPGRALAVRVTWIIVEALTLLNPLFLPSGPKAKILRAFGARIGENVLIKPNFHVKHPWRLTIGDNVWLGERAWIDNLVEVTIGSNACVSQGAYLCTGNHD